MEKPIVILTDFGTSDPFVGIMKGVIAGIAPGAPLIDLTHNIPPGDIRRGAITLWQSLPYFPKGTVFLVVVDPGVGTARHPILLESQGCRFIGPDNGVFTLVQDETYQAWTLQNPHLALPNPRMTFHGRDIFAPAAAHAWNGIAGPDFGEFVGQLKGIPLPRLEISSSGNIHGEILYADRFGNLLTSLGVFDVIDEEMLALHPWVGDCPPMNLSMRSSRLRLPDGSVISWASTFAEIPDDQCAALLGSSGLVEIAANRQSAAKRLNLKGGEKVTLIPQFTNEIKE